MSFSIERTGDVSTVRVADQLVGNDRAELRREILAELATGVRLLRMDFSGATYIDGAGLGLLVSISRVVREHDAEMRLTNLGADLRTLLSLTKLDLIFTVERSDDDGPAERPTALPPLPSAPARGAGEERPNA